MANESCPDQPAGSQQDLNGPVDPAAATIVQRHNLQDIRPLCAAGISPAIVTGVIMRLLASHFSQPGLIMTENLRQYVYSTDGQASKIRIAPNTRFDPKAAGLFPALIVKRGDLTSVRKAMGDQLGSTKAENDAGLSSYVRFHQGSHQVFVLSEADGEAEDLALEVFDLLTFMSPVLTDLLPFHSFEVTALGGLGVLDAMGNRIGVPITVQYTYEYAWSVQPIAPRLKTISTQIVT